MTDVLDAARDWMADDPDPTTRAELAGLVSAGAAGDVAAIEELTDRFSGPLEFGTAGLRGALGAGPNRMNRSIVIRAAAGLSAYLVADRTPVNGTQHCVVVGFDARHGSRQFAIDTVAVLTAAGIKALLMPRVLPTPVLAFAVRHLDADAGVMVTASHNPPQDNGYKVYLGGADAGSQIVSPADSQIASYIAGVTSVSAVPRATDGWSQVAESVVEAYVNAAAAMATSGGPRDVRIVLTSLHGVGGATVMSALKRAGFTDIHAVPEQAEPDPTFPTVVFPNPEEPGALDLAVALASDVDADIVIANDPDADRCAVALPTADRPEGWRPLTGDEVGALLGEYLAGRGATGTFANSIVSSRLLAKVAAAHGLDHAETLTGFKWISRAPGLAYGYEEAIGYCVDPASVRDKDGISTAVLVADLAATRKATGSSIAAALDELAARHGVHATDQLAIRVAEVTVIAEAMARLRQAPPTMLAGSRVATADDLLHPGDGLPPTDGLRYLTVDRSRVVVRPSGTEPKLKCYLEVIEPVSDDLATARTAAARRLARLRTDVAELITP